MFKVWCLVIDFVIVLLHCKKYFDMRPFLCKLHILWDFAVSWIICTVASRRYSSQLDWKWFWKLGTKDRGLFRFRYICLCKHSATSVFYFITFFFLVVMVEWLTPCFVPIFAPLRSKMSSLNQFVKPKMLCFSYILLMICGCLVDRSNLVLSKFPCRSLQHKGLQKRY